MNRIEITQTLTLSEDTQEMIKAVAWARGRGPDDSLSTQQALVPTLLGQQEAQLILKSGPDDSMPDIDFRTVCRSCLARFDATNEAHTLLKWWLCLTIIDLGDASDEILEAVAPSAEVAMAWSVRKAEEFVGSDDFQHLLMWTGWEWCIASETMRAVSRFRSDAAVDYLGLVWRGEALRGRQLLSGRREFAICAAAAIGTERARHFLANSAKDVDQELEPKLGIALESFGQRTYDALKKALAGARSRPGVAGSGVAPRARAVLCYAPCCVGLFVAPVLVVLEKASGVVRFHARQSLLFHAVALALWLSITILQLAAAQISSDLGRVIATMSTLLGLGIVACQLLLMALTLGGKQFELPIIGGIAKKWAA